MRAVGCLRAKHRLKKQQRRDGIEIPLCHDMHGEEFPLSRRCELGKERKGVPRPIPRQDGFKTETAPRCEMQRFLFPQKVEHLSVDAP